MTTYNEIGSGGALAAGQSVTILTATLTTSGGTLAAGSAGDRLTLSPACHCNSYQESMAGGWKIGGTAPLSDNAITGGFALGGSATILTVGNPYEDYAAIYPLGSIPTGSIGEYLDHSGNDLNGTGGLLPDGSNDTTAVPTQTSGVGCQYAQEFDGHCYIGTDPDCLIPSQSFTISCWGKIQTFGKARTFFSRGYDSGEDSHWICSLGHTFLNQVCFTVQTVNVTSLTVNTVQGSTILQRDTYYHFAAVFNPGVSISVYVNGVLANTRSITGTQTPTNDSGNFIGRLNRGSIPTGTIQEVRLSGVVRSSDWLLAEYNNLCGSFYSISDEVNLLYA